MAKELTEKQEKLLELIFLPEYSRNHKQACIDAGYAASCIPSNVLASIKKEILDKVDTQLALTAPESLNHMLDILNNPDQKGARIKLDAATTILDRVGLTKKDRLEIEIKATPGLLILPSKKD